jgi:hypothetical protein
VPTASQNIRNIAVPPNSTLVRTGITGKGHLDQTDDTSALIYALNRDGALGASGLQVITHSPVDIVVTDPDGNIIAKTESQLDLAGYQEHATEAGTTDVVTVPFAPPGTYLIDVVPDDTAARGDTFRLTIVRNGVEVMLADGREIEPGIVSRFATEITRPLTVAIAIKPEDPLASIRRNSSGLTAVAILSAPDFLPRTEVDKETVTFGRTGYEQSLRSCTDGADDFNADGESDLVCHFRTKDAGFESGDTVGTLRGKTRSGRLLNASEVIRVLR